MTEHDGDQLGVVLHREVLKSVVNEVRAAVAEVEAEPSRGLKSLFPAMWCEYVSIVLAEVLRSRGLGIWTFVDAGHHEGANGHAWIELLDEDNDRLWTIDATIDQFRWGTDGPFISEEQTPSASTFTRTRFKGDWKEWPVLERNSSYQAYLAAFSTESKLL